MIFFLLLIFILVNFNLLQVLHVIFFPFFFCALKLLLQILHCLCPICARNFLRVQLPLRISTEIPPDTLQKIHTGIPSENLLDLFSEISSRMHQKIFQKFFHVFLHTLPLEIPSTIKTSSMDPFKHSFKDSFENCLLILSENYQKFILQSHWDFFRKSSIDNLRNFSRIPPRDPSKNLF